ncbi:hypothetical protein J4H86_00775 [Spiractinospora alimapuensis]|uniref:hypothetical protein n=1 Tax=Spiractinospora alimapuensis TaxID=2820884 RepID=UPI001F2129ED|nr:hypothetical protein [Spiractinospora alimapuensis]QVQ52431.1 hypothetical protein J4H86_00775 [Spiractinospora alimapuensis]
MRLGAVEYRMLVAYRQVFPRRWSAVRDRTRDNRLNRLIRQLSRRIRGSTHAEGAPSDDQTVSWGRTLWNASRTTILRAARAGRDSSARGRAVARSAASTMTRLASRIRPRPLGDGAVVAVLGVVTLAMLAVSLTMAFVLSAWLRTSPGDVLLAAGSAVTVGILFMVVMFLVFASKDRTVRRGRSSHVGTEIATRDGAARTRRARRPRAKDDSGQSTGVADAA